MAHNGIEDDSPTKLSLPSRLWTKVKTEERVLKVMFKYDLWSKMIFRAKPSTGLLVLLSLLLQLLNMMEWSVSSLH